jgi:hypothetical protein
MTDPETFQGVFLGDLQGVFLGDLQGVFLGDLQGVFLGDLQGVFLGDLQGVFLGDLQRERKKGKPSRLSCLQTTPAVIIARPILVLPAKAGPLTNQRCVRGGGPEKTSQQVTGF